MKKFTEGSLEWYRAILNQIINDDMTAYQNQKDCLDLLLNMNIDLPFKDNPDAQQIGIKVSQYAHNIAEITYFFNAASFPFSFQRTISALPIISVMQPFAAA